VALPVLRSSPYFRNLLARWDDCSDRQEDGSYFIDADPDVFQHVLSFMRRPSKFPLFWTKERSFDYTLYNRLEAEADYFLLHDLRDWLRKKRYLDAVKITFEAKSLSEYQLQDGRNQRRCEADIEVQSFFGHYLGNKSRCCPRGVHGEYAKDCDYTECAEIIQAHGPQYDDPPKRLTLVIKTIVFDETVCVNEKP
jgi:hypothetical protein